MGEQVVTPGTHAGGRTTSGAAGDAHLNLVVRPTASPSSLGLYGLACATLMLSSLQLAWLPPDQGPRVAQVLMGFSFLAQLIASLVAFSARDGAVATAMGVLSLTWLVSGVVMLSSPPGSRDGALGLFLLLAAVAVCGTGVAAALSKLVPGLVFLTAAVRLALTGVYQLTGSDAVRTTAGVVGLALLALALYAAVALQLEDARGRTVLPLGRHGQGELPGPDNLRPEAVASEPGVRPRL